MPDQIDLIKNFIEFGKKAQERGLIWGNSGNVSFKVDNESFMITGSGAYLGELRVEDMMKVRIRDGVREGTSRPSMETSMHREIFNARKDVTAVFHSQPFYTTLISCTDMDVESSLFPESMAYLDGVRRAPYKHPGSMELAREVADSMRDCDCVILANHGAICAGKDLEDVLLKTETLEFLCRLLVFSRMGDLKLNFLDRDVIKEFCRRLKEQGF